jgi:acyl-CoA synthetase (AMP-forming)/AMP-acid ligase II
VSGVVAWLDDPATDRGVHLATPDGGWQFWPYDRLADLARRYGRRLVAAGVRPGEVVTLVEETGPEFIGLLFGAMWAGAVVSPLAPPPSFGDRERYHDHLRSALRTSTPRLVLHHPRSAGVAALCAGLGVAARASPDLLAGTGPPLPDGHPAGPSDGHLAGDTAPAGPDRLALLQFTSGTSGRARGVRVPHTALAANLAMIRDWLRMTPDDPTASWLPVHHDMGLVGCLLAPVTGQTDLWLMPPSEFVRRPLRYLECFGRHGARLTAMPAFGLAHVLRRVRPEELRGLDFAHWRAVIVGAERVPAAVLDRFGALCAPYGFRRDALLPAYGLAEATLAVTGVRLATGWRSVPYQGGSVVGCGTPLPGVSVRVTGPDGLEVPEGTIGEIVVGGGAVCAGYAATAGTTPAGDGTAGDGTVVEAGLVRTGDAGFLRDGELFVLGRRGDSVKVRGRAVYAEDVEAVASAACDAPPGRIVALLGQVGQRPVVALVLEHPRPDWPAKARRAAGALTEDLPVETVVVGSGQVARTTSGKPRRRQMWADYQAGRLSPTR